VSSEQLKVQRSLMFLWLLIFPQEPSWPWLAASLPRHVLLRGFIRQGWVMLAKTIQLNGGGASATWHHGGWRPTSASGRFWRWCLKL